MFLCNNAPTFTVIFSFSSVDILKSFFQDVLDLCFQSKILISGQFYFIISFFHKFLQLLDILARFSLTSRCKNEAILYKKKKSIKNLLAEIFLRYFEAFLILEKFSISTTGVFIKKKK